MLVFWRVPQKIWVEPDFYVIDMDEIHLDHHRNDSSFHSCIKSIVGMLVNWLSQIDSPLQAHHTSPLLINASGRKKHTPEERDYPLHKPILFGWDWEPEQILFDREGSGSLGYYTHFIRTICCFLTPLLILQPLDLHGGPRHQL